MPFHVKLGGNVFPTIPTELVEFREMLPIAHPMVMGFDGMAYIPHPRLMKLQGSLHLHGFSNQVDQLVIDEVVKNVVKGGV